MSDENYPYDGVALQLYVEGSGDGTGPWALMRVAHELGLTQAQMLSVLTRNGIAPRPRTSKTDDPDVQERVWALYTARKPIADMELELGMARSTIYTIIRKVQASGGTWRRKDPDRDGRIAALLRDGVGVTTVMDVMGVTREVVERVAERRGLIQCLK